MSMPVTPRIPQFFLSLPSLAMETAIEPILCVRAPYASPQASITVLLLKDRKMFSWAGVGFKVWELGVL
jgi:hypothetical protein